MNRKYLLRTAAVITLAVSTAACSYVAPGQVGVKIHTLGGDRGVEPAPITGVGYYYTGPGTSIEVFPTSQQNYTWTQKTSEGNPVDESITFSDINGMSISADLGISYQIDPLKAPALYQKYRKGIDEITNIFLHNMVRDALNEIGSKHPVEYIYGAGRTQIIADAQKMVQQQVSDVGIDVQKIYWVGALRLPESIQAALNSKQAAMQAAQQRENEVATANAQAQIDVAKATGEAKAVTVKAQAQADANRILAASITPELVQYQGMLRWNGQLPVYNGGGATMLFNPGGTK